MNWNELIANDKVLIPVLLTIVAFGSMYYFGASAVPIVSTIIGTMGGIIMGKAMGTYTLPKP